MNKNVAWIAVAVIVVLAAAWYAVSEGWVSMPVGDDASTVEIGIVPQNPE